MEMKAATGQRILSGCRFEFTEEIYGTMGAFKEGSRF